MKSKLRNSILGLVVGDALGVPYEFLSTEEMQQSPCVGMVGHGTHDQPAGTWSDDTSLTLCLMDSLCNGYDVFDIGDKFVGWLYHNKWTPHGKVFDTGMTTYRAIRYLNDGGNATVSGEFEESSNGNGSLMRILPMLFYVKEMEIDQRYRLVSEVSTVTHAHVRSILSCFYYVEYGLEILNGSDKSTAYHNTNRKFEQFVESKSISKSEISKFHRILDGKLSTIPEKDIFGTGYVVHSLEASLWCILTSNSYPEAVLKAVNLGEDTDTTAAITGGLAGLIFGDIPPHWIQTIVKLDDIEDLIAKFSDNISLV